MSETRDEADTAVATGASPSSRTGLVDSLFRFQSFFGLLAVFLAAIVFSPRNSDGQILFLTSDNLFNITRQVSEIGIIAIGLTFVILIGGIDLSVGSVLGLAAVGSAVLMVENNLGMIPAVLLVLLAGAVFGFLQGAAVALLGVQAFIVTLAGLQIARGLARMWSGGETVQISYGDGPGQAPMAFSLLGERTFGGVVPIPAIMRPATAGPTMRARENDIELSATAFGRSVSPTSSVTKVWRTGASNAEAQPSSSASA